MRFLTTFKDSFEQCAIKAWEEWEFPAAFEQLFDGLNQRITPGVLATIGYGLEQGIVIPVGRKFTLRGLREDKGPYNWFCPHKDRQCITPNWEYYVQIAEFVRLYRACDGTGRALTFEDSYMDIGVYEDNKLMVCCEVKEQSRQAKLLIDGIRQHETGLDETAARRGNDPLSKAKYIVQMRPTYFCVVAIGVRYEFSVRFPEGKAFELNDDVIPII